MKRAMILVALPPLLLCMLALSQDAARKESPIDGWKVIQGEWKSGPLFGEGYLEYQKTIQGKMEISGKVQYDLQTDNVWGFGIYPPDGSFITVFVEGKGQLTIRHKPPTGDTQNIAATQVARTVKKPVSFRCTFSGNQVLVMVGRVRLQSKLSVSLEGAKVRLCAVGQPATFSNLLVKE